MKKNLFIILFSMMVMSGASFLFSSSVEAGECARTGTKIQIDTQSVNTNEFSVSGDDASGFGQRNCIEEPLYYKVSIYKVLFCTADPYVSNDNPDFKSCIGTIFETTLTTGKEIIIQSGVPSDLIDNSIILPIGSYSYAAIIVDNHLGLKHTETFIDKDGAKKVPVMLHRALFGSLERFIGILIENYAGKLPFWLAPTQVVILPIAEENNNYVKKLFEDLFKEGIKCEVDLRNQKINYKIREHSLAKVPIIVVCGKKEVADNTVTIRRLGSEKQETIKKEDFIKNMLIANKLPLN